MPSIIRNGKVVADNWLAVDTVDGTLPQPLPDGDLIVPLALWLAHRDALIGRGGRLGIRLEGHDDPEPIAQDIGYFDLIAVNFPQFTDGRGYSLARLLRERFGYRGELRAVGDVLRDNLFYLSRCGFNAFELADSEDPAAALAGLDDFSDGYQSSVERPQPLFRRRIVGASA